MIRNWRDVQAALAGLCAALLVVVVLLIVTSEPAPAPPPATTTPSTFGTTVDIPPLCEQLPNHC